ncbi:SSS family solute:Na+ symporter [Tamaricihabitans halophyticus]|uniref:SSS family solute:Na+ symporter n=1 Tax=Tamaricihabitans halophyticus TaxID=1262583 RepID=A0A4R2QE33_9PSEU|nr:sodium:solute symporter [Tamaricihabitans halophyticus]TCP47237.1 SSS family solute:Na+ symporter [Tamaricihabitans halophyticus]
MLDYLVIAAYFAGMLIAGYIGLRKTRGSDDFLVAGRRLGPFMYTSAMSAVVLGGASTVGGASLGYQYGVSGMALVFMLALGITAIGLLFSSRLSRLGLYTVSELVGLRFGLSARRLSGLVVVFYTLMVGVGQVVAIGTVVTVLLDVSASTAVLLGWAIIMVYSIAGGMWSVTLTDVVQFCVKTVGVLLVLAPLAISKAGGLSGMAETLPDFYFSPTGIGIGTIFAYFLLFFFGFMIDQGNWQRVFTARTERVAFWGCIASGAYCAFYGLVGALVGAAAKVLLPNLSNPDDAYARVADLVLPVGLFGLVIAAALASTMSTASGLLLGSSTVLVNDLFATSKFGAGRKLGVGANRIALVLIGLIALVISFAVGSVVGAVTVAADLLAATVFVPVLGALFWRRASTLAAMVSMVVSAAVCIGSMVVFGLYANEPVMYGLLASLVSFVAVALLVKREPAPPLRMAPAEKTAAGSA